MRALIIDEMVKCRAKLEACIGFPYCPSVASLECFVWGAMWTGWLGSAGSAGSGPLHPYGISIENALGMWDAARPARGPDVFGVDLYWNSALVWDGLAS